MHIKYSIVISKLYKSMKAMLCKVVWEICCKVNWENKLGFPFSCFFSVPRIGINTQQKNSYPYDSWIPLKLYGEFMISCPYSLSSE